MDISKKHFTTPIDPYTKDFHLLLKTFIEHTDEKIRTVEAISKFVLPRLTRKRLLADIGCGDGTITAGLVPEFESFFCLDRNPENLARLKERVPASKGTILQSDLNTFTPNFNADLLLFSYSFGYIGMELPKKDRNALRIQKFREYYRTLNPGGMMVLVETACQTDGYRELFERLGIPVYDELLDFQNFLSSNYEVKMYPFPVKVVTDAVEKMVMAIRLIIYDDGEKHLHKVPEIERYSKVLRRADGDYELSYEGQLLVIRKEQYYTLNKGLKQQ